MRLIIKVIQEQELLGLDLSGNNNNGTLTNGPTFNSANGGSIAYDGADDSVNLSFGIIKCK